MSPKKKDSNLEDSEDIYEALEKSFKKRGLGRGLNALFEDEEGVYPQIDNEGQTPSAQRKAISISQIAPGPYQPRTIFNDERIAELADSMREHGVLQPLLVRANPDSDGMYEIVAGERRWRAAQKAGIHEIPVIIRNFTDKETLEIGLIENLQREDLNPLDEARALEQLMAEFSYTQNEAAQSVGKSRSYVANMVRLTTLPKEVQKFLENGELSAGHARTLVTAKDPLSMAKQIVNSGLSVRDAEKLTALGRSTNKKKKATTQKDINTIALEKEVSDKIGLNVTIDMKSSTAGKVTIAFRDLDQLDEIVHRLTKIPH